MNRYFLVPFLGVAVLIFLSRGIVARKALLVCGGISFLVGVALFGYFFYQNEIFSREECLLENGCMNEFGGFILFPVSASVLAVVLGLAAIIVPSKKKQTPKHSEKQVFRTNTESFSDASKEEK